jgi:hypothetical protein
MLKMKIYWEIKYHKENTEILIDANKEVVLEINVEKSKYMLLCRHQIVGKNRDIKIADRSMHHSSNIWRRL